LFQGGERGNWFQEAFLRDENRESIEIDVKGLLTKEFWGSLRRTKFEDV
jgi:hypothetical protein